MLEMTTTSKHPSPAHPHGKPLIKSRTGTQNAQRYGYISDNDIQTPISCPPGWKALRSGGGGAMTLRATLIDPGLRSTTSVARSGAGGFPCSKTNTFKP
jgi:hypothetical protein